LASNEVNDVLIGGQKIYAATKNGLSILPLNLDDLQDQPVLQLQSILINGFVMPVQSNYTLAYSQNSIQLNYVCLSYKSLKHIDYYYKVDGIDRNWQQTPNLNLIYPALAPGDYTFHLKAKDIDGVMSSEISPITFSIRPPWWKTGWFLASLVLAMLLGFLLYMRWRVNAVQKKAAEQNEINKKFAELELQALQSQMNPHFVFNALQAIQDFIFNKDELVANQYLVKFSRLMRLFLESSKEKYITLSDELDLLNLYIDLEKMRFEDRFGYQINVDPALHPETVELPAMILQPFVENAINHGLIYKKTKGHLSIDILQKENFLHCLIKDDGIGRRKAKALKAKSYKSYKSRGMQLVEERQRMLRIVNQSEIDINIIDLEDEEKEPKGTLVDIKIYTHPDAMESQENKTQIK